MVWCWMAMATAPCPSSPAPCPLEFCTWGRRRTSPALIKALSLESSSSSSSPSLSRKRQVMAVCRAVAKDSLPAPATASPQQEEGHGRDPKEAPRITQLLSMFSPFNKISVLEVSQDSESDFAGSRILILDESGNVQSIFKHDCKWTNFYWDQFATLPPIIPEGPIAILGLGAGTAARLMLDLWPSRKLIGWEVDEILIDAARMYFGLSDLEVPTADGGVLQVVIDDALSPSATVNGGFAGIIVDLFADGQILPQLQQPQIWLDLKERLKDGGRIMVNCGGMCVERSDSKSGLDDGTWTWEDGGFAKDATLKAIAAVFQGQTLYRMLGGESDNFMALTGPSPDLTSWAAALPPKLQVGLTNWKTFPM